MLARFAALVGLTIAAFPAATLPAAAETAIFAGGCFWCTESDMDHVPGVTSTVSGYTGGSTENPTYRDHADHREAVQVEFDPGRISYAELTKIFFRTIDPTDGGGQFCDRGHSYSPAVYTNGAEQKQAAEAAKAEAAKTLGKPIATEIAAAKKFWPAEDYHQNFWQSQEKMLTFAGYKPRAEHYKYYREGCGRDARLKEVWGSEALQGVAGH